ncbi:anaerobic ribonucleoside-triphosphate reductase activating protein [Sulfurospirillum sp. 1612]|uniref:anaerobic ribonucleoside-triphosphate reductase activating protein n=1 Tax=Sulfurospirillum sp. 1612 TaxID=3094835 RepID=UPI002F922E1E
MSDLLEDSPIFDITPFTMLDFPKNLASIFWFAKCNMRCPYCYNPDIVLGEGSISVQKALDFLNSRVGKLTGVVLSGGECTLYSQLERFAQAIKALGFKIKIDTNGTNPKRIKTMVQKNLVDYIALDYKAPSYKFESITHHKNFHDFKETLQFLIDEDFPFEARTTVHSGLLTIQDINHIIDDLTAKGYHNSYFLQNYFHTGDTVGDIEPQTLPLDTTKLNQKIDIQLREF